MLELYSRSKPRPTPRVTAAAGKKLWQGVRVTLGGGLVVLASCGGEGDADPMQESAEYATALLKLPVDEASAAQRAGTGSVVANVVDGALVIEGTFSALDSPATSARLHRGRMGLRGEPLLELELQGDVSGSIGGTVAMDTALREALLQEELYVQISTAGFPEGALRGWLIREGAS